MKLREHIDKIAWSAFDKGLFVIYGFVTLIQLRAMDPHESGLYALLISFQQWIFILSDSSALQGIIQFGAIKENRKKVNFISLNLHIAVALGLSILFAILSVPASGILREPRLAEVALFMPLLNIAIIPRTFCVKFFYRDMQMNKLFYSDLSYLGSLTIVSFSYLWYNAGHLTARELIWVNIICSFASSLITIGLAWKQLEFGRTGNIRVKDMLKFSVPLTIFGAIHNLPRQMDIYIVQYFFSTAASGIYFSAKTLYRFFDSISDAAFGLIYPATVRKIHAKDREGLVQLMTKAVSFTFLGVFAAILTLELGGTYLLVNFLLGAKYVPAIGQFNLMMLAALGLPPILLSTAIIANNQNFRLVKYVAVSAVLSGLTFMALGWLQLQNMVSLGLIVYTWSYGILSIIYAKKELGFPIMNIFASFKDSVSFVKELSRKK